MILKHIDHIGVIVNNLEAAKEFFVDLGFRVQGEAEERGELLDALVGLQGAHSRVVFLEAPSGQTKLELAKFLNPADKSVEQKSAIYAHGYQHIALVVEDIENIVKEVKQKGMDIIVDVYNFQDVYKLCYFRGPEGIIIELAEEL
jgi:catechol 2,3-dioxygenase-like lactoylglutathione lyase family enzyme